MATQVKKVVRGPLSAFPEEAASVSFVGPDGSVFGTVTLESFGITEKVAKALPPIAVRSLMHAASQKVGDAYAGAAKAESPLAYVRDAIRETIEQIVKGEWRVTSPGGPRISMLARALARAVGKTVEEAQIVVDHNSDLDDDGEPSDAGKAWLKNLRAQDAIKAATAAIKLEDAEAAKAKLAEQAAKGGDSSGLAGLFQ